MAKQRLDLALVVRGLVPSREQARAAVEAGRVRVGGQAAVKPAMLVFGAGAGVVGVADIYLPSWEMISSVTDRASMGSPL